MLLENLDIVVLLRLLPLGEPTDSFDAVTEELRSRPLDEVLAAREQMLTGTNEADLLAALTSLSVFPSNPFHPLVPKYLNHRNPRISNLAGALLGPSVEPEVSLERFRTLYNLAEKTLTPAKIRRTCTSILRFYGEDAFDALLQLGSREVKKSRPRVLKECVASLRWILENCSSRMVQVRKHEAKALFYEALARTDDLIRVEAAGALAREKSPRTELKKLRRFAKSRDVSLRAAQEIVRAYRVPLSEDARDIGAEKHLFHMLVDRSESGELSRTIITGAFLRFRAVAQHAVEYSRNLTAPGLRAALLRVVAAGAADNPECRKRLIEGLFDFDRGVRQAALRGLEPLSPRLHDASSAIFVDALNRTGKPNEEASEFLKHLMEAPEPV